MLYDGAIKKKEVTFMKRKTITNRLLALTLSCGMLAASLTGCGSSTESKESSASQSQASSVEASTESKAEQTSEAAEEAFDARTITEGVKLTIAIPTDAKVLDYETNEQARMIEEALGVELEFMVIPSADYASKLNVMVMGGEELPDIIFNPSGLTDWIEEGVLVELSEYYDNPDYSANIRDGMERTGLDLIMYMTRPNGEKYAIPRLNQSLYNPVAQKMYIYQPWLDELGLDVPTTTEEFYEACKLVVENDMNGNGKKDEIGMAGYTGLGAWFDGLMSAFVYAHDSSWYVVEDGQISFAYTSDAWKEGLKYMRKFFEEGLIPTETLTQSKDQLVALYASEEPVLFSMGDWLDNGDLERRNSYATIPALQGPEGVQYACRYATVPSTGAVITTDCENPLAAFLVCDYMCSRDMSITTRYGLQGTDWDYWDVVQENVDASEFIPTFEGYDIVFYAYDMINFWTNSDPQNHCFRQKGPYILDGNATAGCALWIGSDDEEVRLNAESEASTASDALSCYDYIPEEIMDYAPLTSEETDEVADIKTALTSYVQEMTCAFLAGEKDIETEWDNYLSELEKIGYKEYLEVIQTAYDRVH